MFILSAALLLSVGCNRTSSQPAQQAAPAGPANQLSPPPAQSPAAPGEPAAGPVTQPDARGGEPDRRRPSPSARRKEEPQRTASAPPFEQRPVREAAPAAQTPPPATPPPPAPRPVLEAGQQVSVRTITALSSKTAKEGDTFEATISTPITVKGDVVVPRGAAVTGRVTAVDAGGRVRGKATLAVQLTRMFLPNGKTVTLSTSGVTREAKGSVTKDAAKIGIGSAVGAAIGAIAGGGRGAAIGAGAGGAAGTGAVLATRGDPAVIPPETVLTFTLKAPVEL